MSVRQWRVTDLYAVLGVSPRASEDEIDAAFRELAKRWHPDRCGGDPVATERFKHITAAYDVIGHPERRARYDHERALAADVVADVAVAPPRPRPARDGDGAGPRRPVADEPARSEPTWSDTTSWDRPEPEWRPPVTYVSERRPRRFHPALVLAAGVVCLVGGLLLGGWRLTVGRAGSSFGARATRTTGTIVRQDGHRAVEFRTTTGATVVTRPGGAPSDDVGSRVTVVYDRAVPSRAVVDHDSTAKEITIWIAVIKLIAGGVILIVVSRSKRLRAWIVSHTRRQHVPVRA
ncbi:MAG TPA: J domain-containing protein [Acidimicrobiia bacterium]|nr:J domain-containing protein [Acidimicrobiia bacterium]